MIRLHQLLLVAGCALALSIGANCALASDARVVKKLGNGDAYYSVAGGAQIKIDAANAQTIPEHATITTGPDAEVYIETFSGAVATIRQNSTVVIDELSVGAKRRARLKLTSGDVVSTLDPSRKSETDYGIVTPTGVAAARGTVFAVRVIPATDGTGSSSVATLSGIVEIDRGPGVPPLEVPYGQASANSAAAQALAALAAADPTVASDIVAAVQVVATNVASSTSAAGSAKNATSELAAVTAAAVGAVPTQSNTIVQTAIRGAVTQGAATAGDQTSILNAISSVTEAAVRAVGANSQQISSITEAAAIAVTATAATTSGSDAALNSALSAIVVGATTAAPSEAAAAAQGAAKGVVETKIADAVATAKAGNPDLTSDQLAAIANAASNSAGTTAAVSIIATTATAKEVALTGQVGNTAATATIGTTIANAVNQGSASGATDAAARTILGTNAPAVTAPVVTVSVSTSSGSATINTTATGVGNSSTSSETVTDRSVSAIVTRTLVQSGNGGTPVTTTAILPPLDQNQPVVSPAHP